MKIIEKINSFFENRRRKQAEILALELVDSLGDGWSELREVERPGRNRVGFETSCLSKVRPDQILIRIILEPESEWTKWMSGGKKCILVHLHFFPKGKLEFPEEEMIREILSEKYNFSFPEDMFGLPLEKNAAYLLAQKLIKVQAFLEFCLFLNCLEIGIREINKNFADSTGHKITFH